MAIHPSAPLHTPLCYFIWTISPSGVSLGEWCNILYTPLQGGVYEKAGPYFTKAGVKFGPYSTRALARVEYGPNFTPA